MQGTNFLRCFLGFALASALVITMLAPPPWVVFGMSVGLYAFLILSWTTPIERPRSFSAHRGLLIAVGLVCVAVLALID